MLLMVGMVLLVLVLIVIDHLVMPVWIIHIDVHIHVDITSHVCRIVDTVVTLHHLWVAHTSPNRHCSYTAHMMLMMLLVLLRRCN